MKNDSKREKLFQIGEEVLYHDTVKKKYYSGKLENKRVCTQLTPYY